MKLLLAAFFSLLPPVRAVGIATTYWPGDGHSGKALGCPAEARRLLGSAAFRPGLPVIATRGVPPCGTLVIVENVRTGQRSAALRLDFGPAGCYWPDGSRTVELECKGGRRAAIADLTRRVAREIGARGHEKVRLRWR